ncbi:DUF2382 domain-containing protein [Clavibacter lycopersici]|uniref:DUF2382 domain-containing protein n=1 Tax=Clavibacter lycopersici TaxID=2301718 RepID=A0A399T4C2_9MICO|nr:PRC and DUF2382 domain-containing protein [Clavibacter lycopersici]RIJ51210.1 DUF2382 domain-containing protein [Clavibacter lycopersici]RIJ59988.1 DUF2382 domain-containing protein [Clavibacter lycopersici]
MIDSNDIGSIVGAPVHDADGDKIGTVGQVYVDPTDESPVWATVKTGLFGTSESFVPLEGADWDRETLTVRHDKAKVKDAPRIDADGALGEQEEDALYAHYGMGGGSSRNPTDDAAGTQGLFDQDEHAGVDGDRRADVDGAGTVGHDTSGPTTDDAMTRSEEQLHVGTERVETGRARLRKHIVTEQQTVTVPVSHEEVRLEREPITDANVGSATRGPDLSEEEHEVVLTEERPVVQMETVPVERVKLGTETVTDERTVTEDVRHEEIEIDGDADGTARR